MTATVELVECAGCGTRGQWQDGEVVNAEDHAVLPLCPVPGRKRGHGPWLPVRSTE